MVDGLQYLPAVITITGTRLGCGGEGRGLVVRLLSEGVFVA